VRTSIFSRTYQIISRIASNIQKAFTKADDYERSSRYFSDCKIVEYLMDHLKEYLASLS
jgi:tRNA(His) 5'-end guanylyltransferase